MPGRSPDKLPAPGGAPEKGREHEFTKWIIEKPEAARKDLWERQAEMLTLEADALRSNAAEFANHERSMLRHDLKKLQSEINKQLEALIALPPAGRTPDAAKDIFNKLEKFWSGMQEAEAILQDKKKFPDVKYEVVPENAVMVQARGELIIESRKLRAHSKPLAQKFGSLWLRMKAETGLSKLGAKIGGGTTLKEIESNLGGVFALHPFLAEQLIVELVPAAAPAAPSAAGAGGTAPGVPPAAPPATLHSPDVIRHRAEFIAALKGRGLKDPEAEALYDALLARARHNEARAICGRAMVSNERAKHLPEFERLLSKREASWSAEERAVFEASMDTYEARVAIVEVVEEEAEALHKAGVDIISPDRKHIAKRILDIYTGLKWYERWAINFTAGCAITTAIGWGTMGAALGVGVKIAVSAGSMGVGWLSGQGYDMWGRGRIGRAEAERQRSMDALVNDHSFDNIKALDKAYGQVMETKAQVERNVMLGRLAVVGGSSILTALVAGGWVRSHVDLIKSHLPGGTETPADAPPPAPAPAEATSSTGGTENINNAPPTTTTTTHAAPAPAAPGAAPGGTAAIGTPKISLSELKEIEKILQPDSAHVGTTDLGTATGVEAGSGGFVEIASHHGDSWWRLASHQLDAHYSDQFDGPHAAAERAWVLDTLKHQVHASDHIDLNQKIDFSDSIGDAEKMQKLIEHAKNLKPAEIANIEHNLGIHTDVAPDAAPDTASAPDSPVAESPSTEPPVAAPEVHAGGTGAEAHPGGAEAVAPTDAPGPEGTPRYQWHYKGAGSGVHPTNPHYEWDYRGPGSVDSDSFHNNPPVGEAALPHSAAPLDAAPLPNPEHLPSGGPRLEAIPHEAGAGIDNPLVRHWVESHPGEHLPINLADAMERLNGIRERFHLASMEHPRFLDNMRAFDRVTNEYSNIKNVRLGDFYDQTRSYADLNADPGLAHSVAMGAEPLSLSLEDGGVVNTVLTQHYVDLHEFLGENLMLSEELRSLTVQEFSEALYGVMDK